MTLREQAFDSSPRRLSKATVIAIHSAAIARFGGVGGIRDEGRDVECSVAYCLGI